MQKQLYALVRDKDGKPKFDDWNGLPDDAKAEYRKLMTEEERNAYS